MRNTSYHMPTAQHANPASYRSHNRDMRNVSRRSSKSTGRASSGSAPRAVRPAGAQHQPAHVPVQSRRNAQVTYLALARKRRRSRALKRIGLSALAVILVCIFAVGGYGLWFSHQLDGALSMGADQDAAVSDALAPSEAGNPFYVLVLG